MEKTKRKKLISSFIFFGIIFFISIILVLSFAPIAPIGYKREEGVFFASSYPVTYGDSFKDSGHFPIFDQFKNINDSDTLQCRFIYNDEYYCLETSENKYLEINLGLTGDCQEIFIVKENSNEKIGAFVEPQKDFYRYGFVFLDENYVYYILCKYIRKDGFSLDFAHPPSYYFSRYEQYRFNLNDGKNEDITLELFYEKIHAIDKNIRLREKGA